MKNTCRRKQTTKNTNILYACSIVNKALWKHYTIEIWIPQFDVNAGKFSYYNASILPIERVGNLMAPKVLAITNNGSTIIYWSLWRAYLQNKLYLYFRKFRGNYLFNYILHHRLLLIQQDTLACEGQNWTMHILFIALY